MMPASISESPKTISAWAIKRGRWIALCLVAAFTCVMPASAQSGDTWKSIAIIGGSTAAGAYVGHKIAGTKGAYIGAAVGATAGYAIDRRRRQNESYNADYPYGNSGPYGDNGDYPSNAYPDSGYYGDSNNNAYPSANQGSSDYHYRSQIPRRR